MWMVRLWVAFVVLVADPSAALTDSFAEEDDGTSATSTEEPSEFWQAVKALSFDDPAIREARGEEAEFALALRQMIDGEEGAEDTLRRLRDATDTRVREESRRVYTELLAAGSRWAEIDPPERESTSGIENDGYVLSAEYGKLPPESLVFPDAPVTLRAKRARFTGTPMVSVTINGHSRWFFVDTGARLTVLASDVARAAGVFPLGDESARAGTGTTRNVAVRPAVIHELNLGGVRISNSSRLQHRPRQTD
jgi:hypothetical protein